MYSFACAVRNGRPAVATTGKVRMGARHGAERTATVGLASTMGSAEVGGMASTDRPLNGQQSGASGEREGLSGQTGVRQQLDAVGSAVRQWEQAGAPQPGFAVTTEARRGGTQQQRTHGPAA